MISRLKPKKIVSHQIECYRRFCDLAQGNQLARVTFSACMKLLLWVVAMVSMHLLALNVGHADPLYASSQLQIKVNKIKTAYLYNFLKYVEFKQADVAATSVYFRVCVLGEDPFGATLDELNNKKAKGLKVKTFRIADVEKAKSCHIIYISHSEADKLSSIFKSLAGLSVLTVSDIDDFTSQGGIIEFITEDENIRVRINLTNARQAEIRISALLLEIAKLTE